MMRVSAHMGPLDKNDASRHVLTFITRLSIRKHWSQGGDSWAPWGSLRMVVSLGGPTRSSSQRNWRYVLSNSIAR